MADPIFKKNDQNKPRFSLLPPKALEQVVRVLTYGADKYGADNWALCPKDERYRYLDAAHRHLSALRQGEQADPESTLPHLAHAICGLLFLLAFDENDVLIVREHPNPITGFNLDLKGMKKFLQKMETEISTSLTLPTPPEPENKFNQENLTKYAASWTESWKKAREKKIQNEAIKEQNKENE